MNVMNSGHVAENAGFQISCAETKNEEGITFLRLKTCQNTFAQWHICITKWVGIKSIAASITTVAGA